MTDEIDRILEQLAHDVESAAHSLYPGEIRRRAGSVSAAPAVRDARAKIAEALGAAAAALSRAPGRPAPPPAASVAPSPRPSVAAPTVAGTAFGWSGDDSDAVLKCITAWLPMGGPQSTAPDTLCIPAGKLLIPTWGERERAREAVRRISS
jgi:hypothetical protein